MTWNNGEAALFLTYLQWDGCGQREVIYGILKNSMHMMKKFAWVSRFFFCIKISLSFTLLACGHQVPWIYMNTTVIPLGSGSVLLIC